MAPLAIVLLHLAAVNAWIVETPYPGNPLKQAVLAGSAGFRNQTGKAEMQLDCRADAGAARLNLRVFTAGMKFDFSPFEGPGGFGERHKLLQLTIGSATPVMHNFSGYYVEGDVFVFSFPLSRSEAGRLTSKSVGGQPATLTVRAAKGDREPLSSSFQLPQRSEPAREVVSPCMSLPR